MTTENRSLNAIVSQSCKLLVIILQQVSLQTETKFDE